MSEPWTAERMCEPGTRHATIEAHKDLEALMEIDGVRETHRTTAVLFAEGELLGGERVYGSERMIRQFAGETFDELEPI